MPELFKKVEIGNATLFLGDCLDVMATMPDKSVDAVITDPPYGIGEASGKNATRSNLAPAKDYGKLDWDNAPASAESIESIRRVSNLQVIFGGNYFNLPPSSCWLVWDKLNGANDFADCEMAWTNMKKAVRIIRHMWNGMLRDSERGIERVHPTQKPVAVMEWCIEQAGHPAVILDPFMGSGSTGVAAMNMGLRFIGVEREPAYFEAACRRIEAALSQPRLIPAEDLRHREPEAQALFPEAQP